MVNRVGKVAVQEGHITIYVMVTNFKRNTAAIMGLLNRFQLRPIFLSGKDCDSKLERT